MQILRSAAKQHLKIAINLLLSRSTVEGKIAVSLSETGDLKSHKIAHVNGSQTVGTFNFCGHFW